MNSQFWNKFPIIRALVPFLLGIILTINLQVYFPAAGWIVLGCVGCGLALAFILDKSAKRHFRWRAVNGAILSTLFFFSGVYLTNVKTDIHQPDFYGHSLAGKDVAVVKVIEEPVEKARSVKLEVAVEKLIDSNSITETSGKAIIYLRKSNKSDSVAYGVVLRVQNNFQAVAPPANPNEFNYRKYLSFHNIYYQAFASPEDYQVVQKGQGSPFISRFLDVRQYLLGVLDEHFTAQKEKSVASALLLGYRDLLDDETIRSYSSTGAMHVLAVSGLHVGIIYLVLNFLLRFLTFSRRADKFLKPALLISLIWCYAIITGLSPSVVRAATMFSFVTVGNAFGRHNNIYSSIAASAFLLLCFNPYYITEVGFLLSYLAVIGIVYFQPKFYKLLYVRNIILDKVWAITCVSLAAQIATFPIGVLYFHQFPTLFFVSNLVVIPAAMIILYLGLSLFFLSVTDIWYPLEFLCAVYLEGAIWTLNGLIGLIENIPSSLIQGITITILEAYLIYALVITVAHFFANRRRYSLMLSLGLIIVLFMSFSWRNIQNSMDNSLVIYKVNGATAMDFTVGKKTLFVADSALIHDEDKLLFHVKHNWWKKGISSPDLAYLDKMENDGRPVLLSYGQDDIAIIDRPLDKLDTLGKKVKYVLLRNSPYIDLQELAERVEFEQLIVDASNNYRSRGYWRRQAEELNISLVDVAEEGAFTAKY